MDDKEMELYRIFQAIDVEHNGCILPEELWDALVKAGIYFHFLTSFYLGFFELFPNWVFYFVDFLFLYQILRFIGIFFVAFGDNDQVVMTMVDYCSVSSSLNL